jgi:thiol-disulfide isomerase/thioredoxin
MKKMAIFLAAALALYLGVKQYLKHTVVPPFAAFEHPMTTLEEKQVNINDSQSEYYLVSYFQTWCGDCVRELPSILELSRKVPASKLSIFMISDEPIDKISLFKVRFNAELNFYQSATSLKELGVQVYPTTYLVDRKGRILMSKLEGYDWASEEVVKLVNR